MPLDETIEPGQTGHRTVHHPALSALYNQYEGTTPADFDEAGAAAAAEQAAKDYADGLAFEAGAPSTADYLVGTTQGGLSAEIVVGTSPGGELGGTWASPTVDTTHSGSSHASTQTAAEATAAAALADHASDTTGVHGIADSSVLETVTGSQTKVDTHINDSSAAHAASAVSFSPTGTIAATDAQTAIAEVASEAATNLATHDTDTTSVHGIANTAVLETTTGAQTKVDTHVNDTSAAHAASAISILDTANDFTATDVEGALAELQSDHEADAQALADHLAVSGLPSVRTVTGNTTVVDGDVMNIIEVTDGGTVTVNDNLTAEGAITIWASGTGDVTVAAGSNVTINMPAGRDTITTQHQTMALLPIGDMQTFVLAGAEA
jgi:hypothetical protein